MEWCEKYIGYLRRVAQDRNKWKEMVKCALDTYGLGSLPIENDDDDMVYENILKIDSFISIKHGACKYMNKKIVK